MTILPADLDELDGTAFVAAMPELERRARKGDAAAPLVLIRRLQDCSSFQAQSDGEITQQVDESYQRQREIQEKYPLRPDEIKYAVTEETRRKELQQRFDQRDRCAALAAGQIGSRLAVAELALQRRDRQTMLDIAGPALSFSGSERVRYAERLANLAAIEGAELDRLAQAGDLDAMINAAYGYSSQRGGLFAGDPLRGYAYAYAWVLSGVGEDTRRMAGLMTQLAASRLSPQQVEQARQLGQALYVRCCKS